jgi:signal transduction histidine kinase
MFFGGSNGMVRFHPDSIKDNSYVPPIVITAFKTFDKIVPLDSTISEKHSIEMSYKENVISFEFVALNYTNPEKNQYAYKLEGFDNEWIYCGTRRYATYTNLDGGSYIFRVKGSNNDGIWNNEGTSIAVIVTPPFWKTWWFRTFGFVAILLSVGGSIRYVEMKKLKRTIEQLEQERALERERTRISQDMHDEVGANLTKIAIISELAMKNAGDVDGITTQLQSISKTSREVVDSIGAIVWAINPKNDRLDNLAGYLREYASDYFEIAKIDCRFDFPDELPSHSLSSVVRRNIFLTVKEAIHNIVKHSAATAVHIRLRLAGRQLEIGIEDNGKGFVMADISGYGNGLMNMKKRVESINGKFDIQSQPGCGTKIKLIVPVTQGILLK